MSEIFDKFPICGKIPPNIKNKIKIFYIFKQYEETNEESINLLFVTNDDEVYGLGANPYGCLGLGHRFDPQHPISHMAEPQLIPDLCQKKIKEFFNGNGFVLALTENKEVYGWGKNDLGQLGIKFTSQPDQYIKPTLLDFSYKHVVQISCGLSHTLALTSTGVVYGWGHNFKGQLGLGNEEFISMPKNLNRNFEHKIQSIYAFNDLSFAILTNGNVFSWGDNEYQQLGHATKSKDEHKIPKLVDIKKIKMVSANEKNTYFLTTEGHIYVCGQLPSGEFQAKPRQLKIISIKTSKSVSFAAIQSVPGLVEEINMITALGEGIIYRLAGEKFEPLKYNNFFDYYSNEYEITYKTIDIMEREKQLVCVSTGASVDDCDMK